MLSFWKHVFRLSGYLKLCILKLLITIWRGQTIELFDSWNFLIQNSKASFALRVIKKTSKPHTHKHRGRYSPSLLSLLRADNTYLLLSWRCRNSHFKPHSTQLLQPQLLQWKMFLLLQFWKYFKKQQGHKKSLPALFKTESWIIKLSYCTMQGLTRLCLIIQLSLHNFQH